MKSHLAGKIIVFIQILLSAALLLLLKTSGLVPDTYCLMLLIILAVMAAFHMFLQFRKTRIFILGIVLSILLSSFSGLGIAGVLYAVRFMDRIAGLDYQTYDMVVVVKAEDKAEQLQDIGNQIGEAAGIPLDGIHILGALLGGEGLLLQQLGGILDDRQGGLDLVGNIGKEIRLQGLDASQLRHHLVEVQNHHVQVVQPVGRMKGRHVDGKVPLGHLAGGGGQLLHRLFNGGF